METILVFVFGFIAGMFIYTKLFTRQCPNCMRHVQKKSLFNPKDPNSLCHECYAQNMLREEQYEKS
jgi:hypothetical protein